MIKNKIKEHAAIVYSKRFRLAFILTFIAITLWEFSYFSIKDSGNDYTVNFNDSSKLISIHIPRDLNFSGEKVPTESFTTDKEFEKALIANTYWKSQTLLLHKRATRWFPIIEPIIKEYNIPEDFKYLALVESKLTNAVSPKGATGFWQFVAPTARSYKLEVNENIDERYHVIKSTHAAAKYFRDAYKIFKNWTLVAASYNRGIGGIKSQLKKQKKKEFYSLKLTKETRMYIFRILAMKEIMSRPKIYGYDLTTNSKYPYVKKRIVTVDSSISDLSEFAIQQGTHVKLLKALNPWLVSNQISNPDSKTYTIAIPINATSFYDFNGNFVDIVIEQQRLFNDTISKTKTDSLQPMQADSLKL